MKINHSVAAAAAVLMLASAPTLAMAQATGKENNATTGSETGSGPNSGMENKGKPDMQGASGSSSSSTEKKSGAPTSAGSSEEQAKGLRGHSEQPTTGK